jgi:putative chitinase
LDNLQPAHSAGFFMELMMDLDLGHTRLILAKCREYGLLRNQAAYVLATARWETAHTMEPVREAYWLSESWRRRNLRYYPWYGRGFVQLTWERNYRHAGDKLGRDFITDPDAVMEPEASAEILVMGMREGWFTGKRLDQYITLSKSNFRGARRIVNGTDKAAAIAELAVEYDRALLKEGYGVEPDKTTPQPPDVPEPVKPPSEPPEGGFFLALLRWLLGGNFR